MRFNRCSTSTPRKPPPTPTTQRTLPYLSRHVHRTHFFPRIRRIKIPNPTRTPKPKSTQKFQTKTFTSKKLLLTCRSNGGCPKGTPSVLRVRWKGTCTPRSSCSTCWTAQEEVLLGRSHANWKERRVVGRRSGNVARVAPSTSSSSRGSTAGRPACRRRCRRGCRSLRVRTSLEDRNRALHG